MTVHSTPDDPSPIGSRSPLFLRLVTSVLAVVAIASMPSTPAFAVEPSGSGTYEDGASAVTLSGSWATSSSPNDSGGSRATLPSPGYAQFSFRTSGVKWISRTDTYSGIADVYIDGVKKQTVDLYSTTSKTQQTVYEISGLPEIAHTIRISYTGTRNPNSSGSAIHLDAFIAPDIYPPSAPTNTAATAESTGARIRWTASPESDVIGYRVYRRQASSDSPVAITTNPVTTTSYLDTGLFPGTTYRYQVAALDAGGNASGLSQVGTVTTPITAMPAGTYENTDTAVTKVGAWTTINAPTTDSGGSYATLSGPGYAEFAFSTSGVKWLTRTDAYSGIADVYIDGVKKAPVDLYSATTKYQQNVYQVSDLPETAHTIRVTYTGTKNSNSGGRNLRLDAFLAPDIYPPTTPTGLTATPENTGARLTFTPNTEPDIDHYTLYRRQDTTTTTIATIPATSATFMDIGLNESTTYTYQVQAFDTTGNASPLSTTTQLTTPPQTPDTDRRYANCPSATVDVATRPQLLDALGNAAPGAVIRMAPGVYAGPYTFSIKGTDNQPVWICGPRTAVIDGGDLTKGYGLQLFSSSNVVVTGMTVRNAQKGVQFVDSYHMTVSDTRVEYIGDEAIHFRSFTTDSTAIGNSISDTGRINPQFGEGIYIGTAQNNWCSYSNCKPDASDRNMVVGNTIDHTGAESIEVKEGAKSGTITRNVLDGAAMSEFADSVIAVQSNDWVVSKNQGQNAPLDGVQVWEPLAGWGRDNVLYGNIFSGSVPGYGVRLSAKDLNNIVGCDTIVANNSIGISNQACQK